MQGQFKAIAAAWAALTIASGGPALAQQEIDEPRLDPIFGERTPERERERERIRNDDEFDNEKGWRPVRDFIGVFTFLTPETTDLSLGIGPVYRPDYFGSNDYEFRADPEVYVKFRNFVFLDNDGADIALFGFSGFSFGPSIRLVGDRDEEDNIALAGLGDVDRTLEVGGFAATKFLDRFLVRAKIRKGVVGGHDGLIVDAAATALLFRFGRVSTSVSGQASWIGDSYADTYFSVTPAQSLASGLDEFDAGRGLRDFGGSFNAYVNIGKRWSLNPYVSYRYIFNGIAETPIIADFGERNQYAAGFHLMRQFEFKWR
ncbi:MAG: MipA/OmpV family protein [Parvularculaceae bacterium]|nr:MipA/OmpV family protein [Parvularculaceae bacterium]